MKSKRHVVAGVTLTWLCVAGACTLEPRYRAPALPVPVDWPMPAATPEGPSSNVVARDVGRRDFFLDTRLQQLIGLALANNRDLRVAVLNIDKAREQVEVLSGLAVGEQAITSNYTGLERIDRIDLKP